MTVTLETLDAKLNSLLAAAEDRVPVDAFLVFPGPNGVAAINGVAMFIDEPIASDWEPSMEARELTRQGRIGVEPSNAFDSGLPKRSPKGYPMVYGVGQYGPQAPGRVKFGGSTFANDAEVAAFRIAEANRLLELAAGEAETVGRVYNGLVAAAGLTASDAGYLWGRTEEYRRRKNRDLLYDLLAGTHHDIARAKELADRTNPNMHAMLPDNGSLPGLVAELMRA